MTRKAGKTIALIVAVCSLLLGGATPLMAAGETMYDYTKIPPFIEVGLNPNLVMLLDNSASMYDPAYAPANQNYCYDDSYNPSVPYAGYFDSSADSWYYYLGDMWSGVWGIENYGFQPWGVDHNANFCANWSWYASPASAIYGSSDLCLMMNETVPTAKKVNLVFAKGRYLNWLASSKFDVEKDILTGGKYDANNYQLIGESRGCLGQRFIKKTPVTNAGTTYYATFGVRPPDSAEVTADLAYNGASSTTRIEIYPATTAGFSFAQCQAAIDAWTDPATGLGTLKGLTTACMEAAGTSNITASNTAFNHILQECWYYKAHGTWQPGAGTVTSLKNDCENVYGAASGSVAPLPAGYRNPGTLNVVDVCYGQYLSTANHTTEWGSGYIGQCWEKDYTSPMIPMPCPVGSPTTPATAVKDSTGAWYYCNASSQVEKCIKNALPSCKAADWSVFYIADPGGSPIPSKVYWTDDNGDSGAACADRSLKKYCTDMDEATVVDSTEVSDPQGTSWGVPAVLVSTAAQAQLGNPLLTMKGLVRTNWQQPTGLIQQFKYNLRMGAMQMNSGSVSECTPVRRPDGTYKASLYDCLVDKGSDITATSLPDTSKVNGGRMISYVDDGDTHISQLVSAINNIKADAWTPLAESYFEAVGYYAQRNSLRLNSTDFVCDQDYGSYSAWMSNHYYPANSRVSYNWDYDGNGTTDETKVYYNTTAGTSSATATKISQDSGLHWVQFDPVVAGCQRNNILIITDGGSSADLNTTMTNFVTGAGHNDGDTAVTYAAGHTENGEFECKTAADTHNLYGATLLDDLSYYAKNGANIFSYPTVASLAKQNITTYVVSAGTLQDNGTTYECNPKTQLQQVAANSGTTLLESTDPSQLETNLRRVFELIGGEPASGSAASVISNSRSGEGAIFQAVFYPKQQDAALREITWAGDVHALWLDDLGNIRQDCGTSGCVAGGEDYILNKKQDQILKFYTDPITSAARARSFSDADGDGHADSVTPVQDNINLRDIRYLWSAGDWLAKVTSGDVYVHRTYTATTKQRHMLTSIDGSNMIAFTPATVRTGLGSDAAYLGYFHATTVDEADDIINYVRGDDYQYDPAWAYRGYRSRLIDWDGNGAPETWKLGDIVNSTPTVVSTPAEDYDLIYGDSSYQDFRKRYRNRRAVIYAGGNDGGLHAFNGGYYNRTLNKIEKAPPADLVGGSKIAYDLGAELWMFVPKNIFPHLKWLTAANYSHVNYVDFKPYIFDAKIFNPDADHPKGWGTVLIGGMGFGGGKIGVDTNGDGTDDQTLYPSYFILDITNPEIAPRIIYEFTDPGLGYTIGSPTAIPMLLCGLKADCPTNQAVTIWPMDWYLAMPSGPHDVALPQAALNGKSDQYAKIFTLPLGGTNATGHLGYAGTFTPVAIPFTTADVSFPNSFFTDVIAVDYNLNFKTDALYFGSVAHANLNQTDQHTGGMHRLVIGEDYNPAHWTLNTFFKTPGHQPVSGSPSVASDGQRAWIYFGTGRYYSAQLDKTNKAQQSYYGLKETYDDQNVMQLGSPSGANLVDVSKVWVEQGSGALHMTSGALPLTAKDYDTDPPTATSLSAFTTTFKALDLEMSEKVAGLDKYNGWKLDFDLAGERNLGQAAILGNIVTFTTFVPSEDVCQPEGESYLWAPYYRTGTGYSKSVIGTRLNGGLTEVERKLDIGVGLASTPNIHSGAEAGSTAFVQTSTGAIISVQQSNPGIVKSGAVSWRECGE